jgi:hypothetical protein
MSKTSLATTDHSAVSVSVDIDAGEDMWGSRTKTNTEASATSISISINSRSMIIIFTTEIKSLNELECRAWLFYSLSTALSQCRTFGMAGSVVYGATATCCWFKFTLCDTEWRVSTSVILQEPAFAEAEMEVDQE